MPTDPKTLVTDYFQAFAARDFARLREVLAEDLQFVGPSMTRARADDYLGALRRLTAIHVRNDIRRVFADGDEVCVVYDFVTDTAAGALPMIEWIAVRDGRIRSIRLFYDRLPWQAVAEEMTRRATHASA